MNMYSFTRENNHWYINLCGELREFNKSDLALLEDSAPLLDFLSNGKKRVALAIDDRPFEKAMELALKQTCDSPSGGGYYQLLNHLGRVLQEDIWLCDVLLYVFGDIPEHVYLKMEKRVSVHSFLSPMSDQGFNKDNGISNRGDIKN